MKSTKKYGFYIELKKEERNMLKIIKDKHNINITGLLRSAIKNKFKELEN